MLYSFYNIDARGTDLRATLRPAHREYLAKFSEQLAFAGPLLAEDGVTPVGSLLVLDFETVEEANAFIKGKPYTVAGLYASVSIRPFLNLWQQHKGFPEPR
jgi:uncharacterized protein